MREFYREMVVWKQAHDEQHDQRMHHAWTIAALNRQEKFPKLETLLAARHQEQRQTSEEMRTVLQMMSEAYKIPLRTGKRRGR